MASESESNGRRRPPLRRKRKPRYAFSSPSESSLDSDDQERLERCDELRNQLLGMTAKGKSAAEKGRTLLQPGEKGKGKAKGKLNGESKGQGKLNGEKGGGKSSKDGLKGKGTERPMRSTRSHSMPPVGVGRSQSSSSKPPRRAPVHEKGVDWINGKGWDSRLMHSGKGKTSWGHSYSGAYPAHEYEDWSGEWQSWGHGKRSLDWYDNTYGQSWLYDSGDRGDYYDIWGERHRQYQTEYWGPKAKGKGKGKGMAKTSPDVEEVRSTMHRASEGKSKGKGKGMAWHEDMQKGKGRGMAWHEDMQSPMKSQGKGRGGKPWKGKGAETGFFPGEYDGYAGYNNGHAGNRPVESVSEDAREIAPQQHYSLPDKALPAALRRKDTAMASLPGVLRPEQQEAIPASLPDRHGLTGAELWLSDSPVKPKGKSMEPKGKGKEKGKNHAVRQRSPSQKGRARRKGEMQYEPESDEHWQPSLRHSHRRNKLVQRDYQ